MARSEETPEQKDTRDAEYRVRNSRSIALINGSLLILGSFLLLPVAIRAGIQEYGPALGVAGGILAFAIMFGSGVLMVRLSKRIKRPTWLRILRFRNTPRQDADPPEDVF